MHHHTVEGDGDPLVLLHGGLSDSTAWAAEVPAFAERYRTFAFDRRGHGGTPDDDSPFDYDGMADETITFIEDVVGAPAHLVGWSDGGIVSLLTSIKRPDLVRRQVLIGANFHHQGMHPSFDTGDDPEAAGVAMLKSIYESVAVDPNHWPVFYGKAVHLFRVAPELTIRDLERVVTPTFVLAGDDDCILHPHTIELFENIGDAQLAIVPGTSHLLLLEKPALVNQLILDFLGETAPPETIFPMRRSHG